jgi:hypothetical protein
MAAVFLELLKLPWRLDIFDEACVCRLKILHVCINCILDRFYPPNSITTLITAKFVRLNINGFYAACALNIHDFFSPG